MRSSTAGARSAVGLPSASLRTVFVKINAVSPSTVVAMTLTVYQKTNWGRKKKRKCTTLLLALLASLLFLLRPRST